MFIFVNKFYNVSLYGFHRMQKCCSLASITAGAAILTRWTQWEGCDGAAILTRWTQWEGCDGAAILTWWTQQEGCDSNRF